MKPTFDYSSVFKIGSHGLVSLVVSGFIANVAVAAPASNALPTGGAVVSGNVNMVTSAATMNINQASSKSVINWNTYNIGSAATVNYNFANAGSSSLNRVLSNNPSEIYGKLNANGKVILVNPNGIVFGSGSSVNVGSLVATTMNIKDADYLNDRLLFTRDGSIGKILTEGTITAEDKGYIALLAPEVVNKGVIKATMGTVSMAAGDKIELTLDASGLKTVIVEPSTVKTLIDNKAFIEAKGGIVYLGAKEANAILDEVMNLKNSGIIEATAMNSVSGKIILDGDNIEVDGTLKATDVYAGNKNNAKTIVKASANLEGNFVETSGKKLGVENGASVKAKTWLLDPTDVVIDGSSDAVGGATVGASVIETALGSGNIQITADNDISVNSAISWSSNKLTLSAGNNINVNSDLTATSTGSLAFYYGQASANGGSSRYTVADGVNVLIPNAAAFTWKKGSGGSVTNLVFDNGNLRFGNGSEASINNMGSLLQPWYYDNVTAGRDGWFKLTYSGYPLDFAIGVGGATSDSWNNNGTILSTNGGSSLSAAVTNLSINISKYFEKTGTITTNMLVNGIQTSNAYTLNHGDYFLKAVTSVTNGTGSDLTNMRLWIGTRDDYVGPNDSNYKTKGNIGSNGFEAITSQDQQAKAIIISEDTFESGNGAAILFYSTTGGADTVINSCCSFGNVFNTNPRTSVTHTEYAEDGSYGLFLNLGTLPNSQVGSVTWYYAAAPVSQLSQTVNQVGQSSGSIPSTPPPPPQTSTPVVVSPVETIVSQMSDNVTKNVEKSVVTPKTVSYVATTAASQSNPLPSTVQVVQPTSNGGSTAQGGTIVNSGGTTQLATAMLSSANPFSPNDNINVIGGGVRVASVESTTNTGGEVRSDVRPSGIVGNTPAAMVTVKQFAPQRGVELAIVAPSTNPAESKVVAKITADTASGFSFNVKEAVNVNVAQKDIKEVKATLDNGQSLPAWLQFDAGTQTFKAVNPPANALPISTKVSITTKSGQTQQVAVEIAK